MIPSLFFQTQGAAAASPQHSSAKADAGRTGAFDGILGGMTSGDAGGTPDAEAETVSSYGQGGLDSLKRDVMASGLSLEAACPDEACLSEFGDLLTEMGFDPEAVAEMVAGLSARMRTGEVSVSDLFAAASGLEEPAALPGPALDVTAFSDGDALMSGLPDPDDLQALSDALDGAEGLPGSLLALCLKQLEGSPAADGASDAEAVAARLKEMQQALTAAARGTETSGETRGNLSLSRFAEMLERRVARSDTPGGGLGTSGSRSHFIAGLAAASDSAADVLPASTDLEGGAAAEYGAARGQSRFAANRSAGTTAESAPDMAGKGGEGQGRSSTVGSASSPGMTEGRGQSGSGKEPGDRFSDLLHSAGREKGGGAGNEALSGAEGAVRGLRAAEKSAAAGRAAAGRTLPGYLLNQVSRQILRLRGAGDNEISLQLKPAHLGRMTLSIEHTDGGIRVGILVENHAARDMLLANTHELKTSLADQGLRLDRIDVNAHAGFENSMAQADQGGDRFGGGRRRRWSGRQAQEEGLSSAAPADTAAGRGVSGSGRLDLVA